MGQFVYRRLSAAVSAAVRRAWPAESGGARHCRPASLLDSGAGIPGDAVQSDLSSEFDVAELEGALSAVARGGTAGRGVQLLYRSAADADVGGDGWAVSRGEDRGGSSGKARPARRG